MFSTLLKSLIVVSAISATVGVANQLKKLQQNHTPLLLTNEELRNLASISDVNYLTKVINNILIPRVVGTKNHEKVFNFLVSELKELGFDVEIDQFQAKTPNLGKLTFKNIIGSLNPQADRFLVLACHYDSKYFKDIVFVGATDSAVPCAMMLNLAKTLQTQLKSMKSNTDLSLKLIFLDGEEAFENWSPRDSIYGARHLAAKYSKQFSTTQLTRESVNELQKIDIFILLDLIGQKNVNFYNYNAETTGWFNKLVEIEDTLGDLGALYPRETRHFVPRNLFQSNIEDDHIPFLKKNVPILHLISLPFPKEWHTEYDDANLIDLNATENLNKILRVFLVEYLHVYLSEDTSEDDMPEKEL